jgi:hypothetical protein
MLKTGAVALAAAAAFAAATPAQATAFLSASANDACGRDGCFSGSTHTFTQAFSANAFQGTVNVGSLLLDRGILGSMQDQLFKVSFHLADGTELGSWGSFMIAVLGGQVVTLRGSDVQWDTSRGDLVLQLDLLVPDKGGVGGGGGGGGGGGFFAPLAGRAFTGGGPSMTAADDGPGHTGDVVLPDVALDHAGQTPAGVVSAVINPSINAVPEPAAWSLMILGFGAAGALLRRRRLTFA